VTELEQRLKNAIAYSRELEKEIAKLRKVVAAAEEVIREEQPALKHARASQKMINLEKALRDT
jgi:hypothetical protein